MVKVLELFVGETGMSWGDGCTYFDLPSVSVLTCFVAAAVNAASEVACCKEECCQFTNIICKTSSVSTSCTIESVCVDTNICV